MNEEEQEVQVKLRSELRLEGFVLSIAGVGDQYLCTTTQGEWLVALRPRPGETIRELRSRGVTCQKVEEFKEVKNETKTTS